MKNIKKHAMTTVALLIAAAGATGCLQRSIVSGEAGAGETMLLETMDHRSYFVGDVFTNQFWECKDTGEMLTCTPSCGGLHDVPCPQFGTGFFAK